MITILISARTARVVAGLLVLALTVGCSSDDSTDGGLLVVATTSIWADVASGVVGEEGRVETLIPLGVDAHDYQPSPQEVAMLRRADLVVANGLGLEEGLEDALDDAVSDGVRVLEVGPLLDPLPYGEAADGDLDPHVWFDPLRVAAAATAIAESLASVDPSVSWEDSARRYAEALQALDDEIALLLELVPDEARKLVTNHQSLRYFAERYGFEIVGVVIPGGSTLAEPSSAELAALVGVIRQAGVRVIFAETTHPKRLAEAVAAEVGEVKVVELYTESLGDTGSGAETLADMLLLDARRIAEALGDAG